MAKYKCNIGKLLEVKGIKQRELAEAIGTTEVSVSRWVNGDRVPKTTTAMQIAKVLDCEIEDLYSAKTTSQTNADRIRAMSDEELAELLSFKVSGCQMCIHRYVVCVDESFDCKDGVLQWLKSEAKG